MKRILTATLALALFIGTAQAQNKKDSARHHGHKGAQTEMMAKELGLTDAQKERLKAIHTE